MLLDIPGPEMRHNFPLLLADNRFLRRYPFQRGRHNKRMKRG
jgi:hypothetical protein